VPHDRRRTARRFEPDVEIHQELPSIRSPLRIAVTHHDVLAHGGDAQSGQWGLGRQLIPKTAKRASDLRSWDVRGAQFMRGAQEDDVLE
jgi:hypothetical protein